MGLRLKFNLVLIAVFAIGVIACSAYISRRIFSRMPRTKWSETPA